ncbi:hypothetical protein [Rahnella victoriana]|uniref:hypothetical protein n=1 Tax=Rahnella victoriana TaxID=1510570 RepID=UPI001E46A046|nr:hypothetical protein [Rahnella victoriana]UHM93061.1 hypothetical protein J9880_23470 [Rahnella victoriana]
MVQKNYDVEEKRGVYLLIKATCHENNYTELNEDILQSISWLSIEDAYNWKMTETLKSVNAEIPSRIYFYYLSSWAVRRAEDPTVNLSRYVMSTNFNGDLLNAMNFYFMILDDDVTPQFVMNALFNRLRKGISTKFPVIKPVEKIFNAELESLSEAEVDIFDSDSLLTSQIKIYVGNIGELWFYFESISPPSTQYFYQWAVTKRALEIVLHSFNNSKMSLN